MNYFNLLLLAIIFLSLGIFATKAIIIFSEKNNVKSLANERSSHIESISSGGGLAFIIITICSLYFFSYQEYFYIKNVYFLLFASSVIGLVGYWDDLRDISALTRFLTQLLSSILVVLIFSDFPEIQFLSYTFIDANTSKIFGIIFLVWLTNLYNFMDGIDGLATIQGIFILFSYIFLVLILDPVSMNSDAKIFFYYSTIILFSSLFGFLFYNFPNSSIFMGDAGSSFLGFFLGSLGIYAAANNWISFWTLIIIWSMFIVDATVTLLIRIYNRDKWYQAHRSHAYQKLTIIFSEKLDSRFEKSIARAKSHRRVCSIYFLINLFWVLPLSFLSIKYYQYGFIIALVCFCPLIISSIIIGAGKRD
jgi:Fuc2NAc and GlcNAc transferase